MGNRIRRNLATGVVSLLLMLAWLIAAEPLLAAPRSPGEYAVNFVVGDSTDPALSKRSTSSPQSTSIRRLRQPRGGQA